jgi:ApaG protein
MYSETTRSIKVTVRPFYVDQHSSPAESHYVWAYHVRIENEGGETVQLRNRHWQITDELGRLQEVRGPGVVGEQPVLKPGQSFEYTSSCPLTTPGLYGRRLRDGNPGGRDISHPRPGFFARHTGELDRPAAAPQLDPRNKNIRLAPPDRQPESEPS